MSKDQKKKVAKKSEKEVKTKKAAKPEAKTSKKAAPAKEAKVEKKASKSSKTEKVVAKKGFPAKASGKKAAKGKKKGVFLFKAPADFKPHFLLVTVNTAKDGLLTNVGAEAIRYQGKFDFKAEDKKKSYMTSYDPATLGAVVSRLSAMTYKSTKEKFYPVEIKGRHKDKIKGSHRLPQEARFAILLRVGRKTADNSLTCTVKTVYQLAQVNGKTKPVELDKKNDPVCRLVRRASRILPAAFENCMMPPKKRRGKAKDDQDGE